MAKKEDRAKILSGLEVRVITEEDSDRVLDFLVKNYSNQHPLREIFGISVARGIEFDRQRIWAKVKDGVSMGVYVKASNALIGVEMNSVATKTNDGKEPKFDCNEKEQIEDNFCNFMKGDIFTDLKTDKILWLSMATVAENYRGLNLASLGDSTREKFAASNGCEYYATLAVSKFSQGKLIKAGYKTLREINYSDYVDPKTGLKPDLKLSPIHTLAAVMYKPVEATESISGKL